MGLPRIRKGTDAKRSVSHRSPAFVRTDAGRDLAPDRLFLFDLLEQHHRALPAIDAVGGTGDNGFFVEQSLQLARCGGADDYFLNP